MLDNMVFKTMKSTLGWGWGGWLAHKSQDFPTRGQSSSAVWSIDSVYTFYHSASRDRLPLQAFGLEEFGNNSLYFFAWARKVLEKNILLLCKHNRIKWHSLAVQRTVCDTRVQSVYSRRQGLWSNISCSLRHSCHWLPLPSHLHHSDTSAELLLM